MGDDIWEERSYTRRLLVAALAALYVTALALALLFLLVGPVNAQSPGAQNVGAQTPRAEPLTATTGYRTSDDLYAPDGAALPFARDVLPAMMAWAKAL